jgi:hypothetical protein
MMIMRNFWFKIFFFNIGLLNAQKFKKNNPNSSPKIFCSFLLTSYYLLYINYSVSPVLGSTYYFWNDKKLTGDKIIYNVITLLLKRVLIFE